ncbi:potassium transporter Kup [Nannocystis bainbridge]|uniref:Probable potassium transport system protein Kup n=1 Tax=Nannocystis bainbridge TaxID=2995303 RepID=A0ABT5DRD4_9BACT|nr:KUP/HAK/KT family potassium transporter [Nannocystis bainbridge]MDC0716219.1 KUP/HAK/KT family potassium transporter [Nannocystis bainbridge]
MSAATTSVDPGISEGELFDHGATEGAPARGLLLAALGVVYGDIGTSPIYAFQESIRHADGGRHEAVLGVLSLFVWSLTIIVAIKYVGVVSRADNRGEGGILALLALLTGGAPGRRVRLSASTLLVIFGTGLLYGDGIITPAISVLSAIEGLRMVSADPDYQRYAHQAIVPATCAVLLLLFAFQRHGTARIGRAFGPVMLVWFTVIAALGLVHLAAHPAVLRAVSPHHAIAFLIHGGTHVLPVLGAVVLCFTGAEALYADLGHFGRPPIQRAWYGLVMPALLLNYFGQAAVVLSRPGGVTHTFWDMVPAGPATIALVLLAMAATVIASQAMITGCFSMTRQAMQLGFFPRTRVVHTSESREGQIYMSGVNWTLAIACIVLVIGMRESSRLASAYGVAVTGTMLSTSMAFYVVATRIRNWPRATAGLVIGAFFVVELHFFIASLTKLDDGGWIPLAVGAVLFVVMITWKQGRDLLMIALRRSLTNLEAIAASAADHTVTRVPGTGVFMTPEPHTTPLSLLHHFKHSKVLPKTVIALAVELEHVPRVEAVDAATITSLGFGFWHVTLRFGYKQTPDVPAVLAELHAAGRVALDPDDVSYFVGRERVLPTGSGPMARWRKVLFEVLSRNVPPATDMFCIPPNRVVELGAQIAL